MFCSSHIDFFLFFKPTDIVTSGLLALLLPLSGLLFPRSCFDQSRIAWHIINAQMLLINKWMDGKMNGQMDEFFRKKQQQCFINVSTDFYSITNFNLICMIGGRLNVEVTLKMPCELCLLVELIPQFHSVAFFTKMDFYLI